MINDDAIISGVKIIVQVWNSEMVGLGFVVGVLVGVRVGGVVGYWVGWGCPCNTFY